MSARGVLGGERHPKYAQQTAATPRMDVSSVAGANNRLISLGLWMVFVWCLYGFLVLSVWFPFGLHRFLYELLVCVYDVRLMFLDSCII